ncbi:MAG: hypothetical protein P8X66_14830 [Maritimibacter sp.]
MFVLSRRGARATIDYSNNMEGNDLPTAVPTIAKFQTNLDRMKRPDEERSPASAVIERFSKNRELLEVTAAELLLRREILKCLEGDYTPPEGSVGDLRMNADGNPWPYINQLRAPAQEVLSAAATLSIGFQDWTDFREPAAAAKIFNDPLDRVALRVVLMSCAAFCAAAEFETKVSRHARHQSCSIEAAASTYPLSQCWPENAAQHLADAQSVLNSGGAINVSI